MTAPPVREAGLQLEPHAAYHRRFWFAQRAWWGLLAAFVMAAVLGAFGNGLLSSATSRDGSLEAHYQAMVRNDELTRLRFIAEAGGADLEIALSSSYLEEVLLEQVVPEPDSVEAAPGEVTYRFGVAESGPITIDFLVRPQGAGPIDGRASLAGDSISFTQFVFP